MRVYNLEGRRDNKYKARVKILVHEIGAEEFIRRVEEEFARLDGPSVNADPEEVARIAAYFAPPAYETLPAVSRHAGSDQGREPGLRPLGRDQHDPAQGAGLHRADDLAEADRRARPATRPPTRCGSSPISPSSIRMTNCASPMRRTSCCRMCASAICSRSGSASARPSSRPPMSG